jgi:hypothetical protein
MRTKLTVAALAMFGLVLAGAPAFAQEGKVTIPFAFTAMGQTLPAGIYTFTEQAPDVMRLESVNVPGLHVELPVIERATDWKDLGNVKAVFGKTARGTVLTQLWLEGEDGYVVALSAR